MQKIRKYFKKHKFNSLNDYEQFEYYILLESILEPFLDDYKVKNKFEKFYKRFIAINPYSKKNHNKQNILNGYQGEILNSPKKINQFKKDVRFFLKDIIVDININRYVRSYFKNLNYTDDEYIKNKKTIILTGTVSSGKSTLINALHGMEVTNASAEICTYENSEFKIRIRNKTVNLIDTPGVNSVLDRNHRRITTDLILENEFDVLLYIFNANKLGTDEEMEHLRWISENVERNKVIFVLNKLDAFNMKKDDIEKTIKDLREDLNEFGFKDSKLCPISAEGILLARKKVLHSDLFDEYDEEEYLDYKRKYERGYYDLSKYYEEYSGDKILSKLGYIGLRQILSKALS